MANPVSPTAKNPKCDISLSNENFVCEFDLEGGIRGITESSSSPSNVIAGNTGQKHGDWDVAHAHLEQSNWEGGRGGVDFTDDDTKFFDASMYTLTPGQFHNPLLRQWGTGFRSSDGFYPTETFEWIPLLGTTTYLDTPFLASASYSADKGYIWIRRVGNPPTLTFTACPDAAGDPDTATKTVTLTKDDLTDELMAVKALDWTTTWSLTSGTKYHLKVTSAGNIANHWEIGVGTVLGITDIPTKTSTAGSVWLNSSFRMFFRVVDADVDRQWIPFLLEGVLFAVNKYADGTVSTVYINGDQGYADDNTGVKTTLVDATKSWTVDDWKGWRVKVIAGPGLGENRQIQSNTATALTVDQAWATTHTTSTRYAIYGGPKWTLCTLSTALTGVVNDVTIMQNQVLMTQGSAIDLMRMHIKSDATYESKVSTGHKADFVHCYYDGNNGNVVWKGLQVASTTARAATTAYADAMTFGSEIPVGDNSNAITRLGDHDANLYVHKTNSVWRLSGDKPAKIPIGLDALPSLKNGLVSISRDMFYHFSWSHSVERIYGSTVSDYGPWKGPGMPPDRKGYFSDGIGVVQNIHFGLDAESGISSVLSFNERGFHELFRGFERGKRVEKVFWQPVDGGNPLFWISYGGELCYLKFPNNTMNPSNDENVRYESEGYIDLSAMNMGYEQLPKVYKDVDILSRNNKGNGIDLFYQSDADVGSTKMTYLGSAYTSPVGTIKVGVDQTRNIRYRIRVTANDLRNPPVVTAVVAKVFARSPVSRVWTIRVKAGGVRKNGHQVTGRELSRIYKFLWTSCTGGKTLMMHSRFPDVDRLPVVVEAPGVGRTTLNTVMMLWTGTFFLTVRET